MSIILVGRQPAVLASTTANKEVLRDALHETKTSKSIELLLDNGEFLRSFKIDYDGGDRHPNLTADPARTDLLAQIIKPLTPEPPAAK